MTKRKRESTLEKRGGAAAGVCLLNSALCFVAFIQKSMFDVKPSPCDHVHSRTMFLGYVFYPAVTIYSAILQNIDFVEFYLHYPLPKTLYIRRRENNQNLYYTSIKILCFQNRRNVLIYMRIGS